VRNHDPYSDRQLTTREEPGPYQPFPAVLTELGFLIRRRKVLDNEVELVAELLGTEERQVL